MEIASAILRGIGAYLVDPIADQFNYLFCFNNNIQDFETQLEKLKATREGVPRGVAEARRNVRIIGPQVEAWLSQVNDNAAEAETVIGRKAQLIQNGYLINGLSPNLKLRYSLSRKAVENTRVLVHLLDEGKDYTQLSYNPPPPCIESMAPSKEFTGFFESRISNMDDIIKSLKDVEINLIGICGMGGIGKTTMMYEVIKKVEEENLFHEVAITVVKQQPDPKKIQGDIAEMLGLKLEEDDLIVRADRLRQKIQGDIAEMLGLKLEEDNLIVRADQLRQRLLASEDNKRILIILDNVGKILI